MDNVGVNSNVMSNHQNIMNLPRIISSQNTVYWYAYTSYHPLVKHAAIPGTVSAGQPAGYSQCRRNGSRGV